MSLIKPWVGNEVSVTLHAAVPVALKGKLLAVDAEGVILEYEDSPLFVPMTSILHVTQLGKTPSQQ